MVCHPQEIITVVDSDLNDGDLDYPRRMGNILVVHLPRNMQKVNKVLDGPLLVVVCRVMCGCLKSRQIVR